MQIRHYRQSLFISAIMILVLLLSLATSTYAWFTPRHITNIEPMRGTISNVSGDLLISNKRDGVYGVTCELTPVDPKAELLPVSTADLRSFFSITGENSEGYAVNYAAANERADSASLRGSVFLRSNGGSFDVYFWLPTVYCGVSEQALACMRLGLVIISSEGQRELIFALDELGNTKNASEWQTVPEKNTVVASINSDGTANYTSDPAKTLSAYAASGTAEDARAGANKLFSIKNGEIVEVQYRLYLEGCDSNCINSVQGADIALQLGFAGTENR